MILAPRPNDESERQAALESFGVLDSPPERTYDDIVLLASRICGTSQALVALVDNDRVWHKARVGRLVEAGDRDTSFCGHAIVQTQPLVVADLTADERFADNPVVVGGPGVRFYAGVPLVTVSGHALGTLCVLDNVPRTLDEQQLEALVALSRQLVTQLELRRLLAVSRREALVDPLTGLGNRRRLMLDFAALLPAATSAEPLHLLLADLDGFKTYNDAFGHTAGDGLLTRLAGKLQLALAGAHDVYRLGGDEFCGLLHGDSVQLEASRTAVHQALTEHGLGFSITASVGTASMPAEARSTTEALQLADERMYQDKPSSSRLASHQTADVLMSILNERDPTLRDHGLAVAQTAIAVGARLGLTGVALSKLATAAELHDVGKMAVPDAILHKPGPLDADEWEFMKTHTVLGERILATAPALATEAALVRSSHERWDGGGYPDGLFWTDIPLGSRIIFAVDAFDAMTSARPYKAARTDADALAELHRCAGTQFDPSVIAALDEVVGVTADRPIPTEAPADGPPLGVTRRRVRATD